MWAIDKWAFHSQADRRGYNVVGDREQCEAELLSFDVEGGL